TPFPQRAPGPPARRWSPPSPRRRWPARARPARSPAASSSPPSRARRPAGELLDLAAVGARQRQLGAVAQGDDVVAGECRVELGDAIDVDDRRTMDAQETVRIEPGLEPREGVAQQVGRLAGVELEVVAGAVDPVHLVET